MLWQTIKQRGLELFYRILQPLQIMPRNRTELEKMLTQSSNKGLVPREIYKIMYHASQSSDKRVRDIMVPRMNMSVFKKEDSVEKWIKEIGKSKHSRYPVIDTKLDNVVGMLLPKDLMSHIGPSSQIKIDTKLVRKLMRAAHYVPESQHIYTLMMDFRRKRSHMFIVLDEHGGTSGLVTLEDALEEIIGTIEDEHDEDDQYIIETIDENTWLVNALTPVPVFNRFFSSNIQDEKIETVGGWLAQKLGHVPKINDSVSQEGLKVEVVAARKRRPEKLRIIRTPTKSSKT